MKALRLVTLLALVATASASHANRGKTDCPMVTASNAGRNAPTVAQGTQTATATPSTQPSTTR